MMHSLRLGWDRHVHRRCVSLEVLGQNATVPRLCEMARDVHHVQAWDEGLLLAELQTHISSQGAWVQCTILWGTSRSSHIIRSACILRTRAE